MVMNANLGQINMELLIFFMVFGLLGLLGRVEINTGQSPSNTCYPICAKTILFKLLSSMGL